MAVYFISSEYTLLMLVNYHNVYTDKQKRWDCRHRARSLSALCHVHPQLSVLNTAHYRPTCLTSVMSPTPHARTNVHTQTHTHIRPAGLLKQDLVSDTSRVILKQQVCEDRKGSVCVTIKWVWSHLTYTRNGGKETFRENIYKCTTPQILCIYHMFK